MTDGAKFLSGTMSALSVMVNLELPHVNLLSKMDLLSKSAKRQLDRFLDPDAYAILADVETSGGAFSEKYRKLTEAIARLIEDYSLVRFTPLNLKDNESISDVLITIDNVLQYGEDQDVKTKDFEEADEDEWWSSYMKFIICLYLLRDSWRLFVISLNCVMIHIVIYKL